MKNKKVYFIVLVSTMAAMAIALEKVGSLKLTQSLKITFYAIPLIVVGMLHGPKLGALTGLISGIVIQLTSEYGINLSSIFFGLAPVVWGFVSGAIFKSLKDSNSFKEDDSKGKKVSMKVLSYFLTVAIASIAANLANTLAMYMDSLFIKDSWYTGTMILMEWPPRLLTMVVTMIPYTFVSFIVCDRLEAFLNKDN